jgi:hypothetical protein
MIRTMTQGCLASQGRLSESDWRVTRGEGVRRWPAAPELRVTLQRLSRVVERGRGCVIDGSHSPSRQLAPGTPLPVRMWPHPSDCFRFGVGTCASTEPQAHPGSWQSGDGGSCETRAARRHASNDAAERRGASPRIPTVNERRKSAELPGSHTLSGSRDSLLLGLVWTGSSERGSHNRVGVDSHD